MYVLTGSPSKFDKKKFVERPQTAQRIESPEGLCQNLCFRRFSKVSRKKFPEKMPKNIRLRWTSTYQNLIPQENVRKSPMAISCLKPFCNSVGNYGF